VGTLGRLDRTKVPLRGVHAGGLTFRGHCPMEAAFASCASIGEGVALFFAFGAQYYLEQYR
jgi:hypothetical protein